MIDGSLDWLWLAAAQAGVPMALSAALAPPTVYPIACRSQAGEPHGKI